MNPQGATIDELSVGQSAQFAKTVTEADVLLFCAVSGDHNPVHINAEYAKGTRFGERIAHGMLSASFISNVLGMSLPGPGTIYLRQNLNFRAPVKIGDTVTATVTVREINRERKRLILDTVCTVGDTVVIDGEAEVIPPSKK